MATSSQDTDESWNQATIAMMPETVYDNETNGVTNGSSSHNNSQSSSQDQTSSSSVDDEEETWPITGRDRPLPSELAIRVMDHAHVVLNKRLADTNGQLDVFAFETKLPRFINSEIDLGKRIAYGNFADIFLIRGMQEPKSNKACTPEQTLAANEVKIKYRPDEIVVKVLRPILLTSPNLYATGAADILTEGTLLAALDHPHIVQIRGRSLSSVEGFASGKRDSFFLLLERLQCNLLDKMDEWQTRFHNNGLVRNGLAKQRHEKAQLLKERLEIMEQLADAMTYLHEKNIIHRDLKLSNVGLDRFGKVKLIDFGLAKIIPPHSNEKELFQMTGNTGSIRYMAPEVARGEPYNLKADVYSFSILLYEVLSLTKAWHGCKPQDIQNKILVRKQRPLISMFWPAQLRDLLKSTWSDIPGARISMTHVHAILSKELSHVSSELDTNGEELNSSAR